MNPAPCPPLTSDQVEDWFTLAHERVHQGEQNETKANLMAWHQLDWAMLGHFCAVLGVPMPPFTLVGHDTLQPQGAAWVTPTELHAVTAPNGQLTDGVLFDWCPHRILYDRLHSLAHELGHHIKWRLPHPLRLPPGELSKAGQNHLNRHLLSNPNEHGAARLFDELFADAAAELMMGVLRDRFPHRVVAKATLMRVRMRQVAFAALAQSEGVAPGADVKDFAGVTWGLGHESHELLPEVFEAQPEVHPLPPATRMEWLCRVVSATWRQRLRPHYPVTPTQCMGSWRLGTLLQWAQHTHASQAIQIGLAKWAEMD
jgi:hypothetical protein